MASYFPPVQQCLNCHTDKIFDISKQVTLAAACWGTCPERSIDHMSKWEYLHYFYFYVFYQYHQF